MKRKLIGLAAAASLGLAIVAPSADGATLLYQYNIDNYTGPGTTISPNVGANGTLGMSVSGNNGNLATGVGPSGVASDLALTNTGVNSNPTGSTLTGSNSNLNGGGFTTPPNNTLNLGALNQFTVTMWVKTNPAVTTGTAFPRLMMVGPDNTDTGTTADSFATALNNGGVEVRVKGFGGVVQKSGTPVITPGQWQFIAFSYDGLATNPSFSPAQLAASENFSDDNAIVYAGSTSTTVSGFGSLNVNTGAAGGFNVSPGGVNIPAGFAYLLNRKDLTRGLNGNGDDFRIYDGLLTLSELETIRSSVPNTVVPEPGSLALAAVACAGLAGRRRRH